MQFGRLGRLQHNRSSIETARRHQFEHGLRELLHGIIFTKRAQMEMQQRPSAR